MNTTILIEQIDLSEAQIDIENRVIKNVVLIRAGMSLNRRYYSESVLASAAPVFEGTRAFDSHVKGERKVSELTGWYQNVRYEESKLMADRYFARTNDGQNVWAVVEDIVSGRAPRNLAGLSINAVGKGKVRKFDDGDALEVESIEGSNSVDDVLNAAAGGSYLLTAASNGDELATALVAAMTYEEYKQAHPAHLERLKLEWKAVRLEEATKTALAEADDKVKQAQAESGQAKQALEEAQTALTTLTTERDTALSEAAQARRELAIERLFRAASLPNKVEEDLRGRLAEAAPELWQGIIQRERDKLKALGLERRVAVSGSGQQVSPANTPAKPDPIKEMRARLAAAKSPEEVQRILEQGQ